VDFAFGFGVSFQNGVGGGFGFSFGVGFNSEQGVVCYSGFWVGFKFGVRFCRIGWDRIAYFVGDLVDWVEYGRDKFGVWLRRLRVCFYRQTSALFISLYLVSDCIDCYCLMLTCTGRLLHFYILIDVLPDADCRCLTSTLLVIVLSVLCG
jgi:hypothetical protein